MTTEANNNQGNEEELQQKPVIENSAVQEENETNETSEISSGDDASTTTTESAEVEQDATEPEEPVIIDASRASIFAPMDEVEDSTETDEVVNEEISDEENAAEPAKPESDVQESLSQGEELPDVILQTEVETVLENEPNAEVVDENTLVVDAAPTSESAPETFSEPNLSHDEVEEIKKQGVSISTEDEEVIEDEESDEDEVAEDFIREQDDLTEFSKKDLLALADKLSDALKKPGLTNADVKNVDNVSKQIQAVFEELQETDKATALKAYVAETGVEEGFEFTNDNVTLRFEANMAEIRDRKNKFYRSIRQSREDYFEVKTALLDRLRVVVEEEEKGGSKENWNSFKKIQDEWKDAGNVNSPHNGSLWSAYNALVDRYFNIRNIQNELKDLDRRKNLEHKTELAGQIAAISATIAAEGYSSTSFKQVNNLFEEYKALGPAPREEQEALWIKVKAAFDVIYDKKREQGDVNKNLQQEILEAKSRLVDSVKTFLDFDSGSINEWNDKTKEVLSIQEQWNAIKGMMPRDSGRKVSKDFWGSIKQFFKNKSAFFERLEAEREENLKAKVALCEEVEAINASGVTESSETNRVIEMQKTWQTIGHVPQKEKNSIYKRFKKAADTFFESKRSENAEVEKEYEENLKAKEAIVAEVEKLTAEGSVDLSLLADFKRNFNNIGFVPRKHIKTIQQRFIDAINSYVKSSSSVSGKQQESLLLKNQANVEGRSSGGNYNSSSQSSNRQETDLRRKATSLESDISLWRNNIEFFGPSKGAEQMRAEFEKKIVKAESELEALNEKLKMLSVAP